MRTAAKENIELDPVAITMSPIASPVRARGGNYGGECGRRLEKPGADLNKIAKLSGGVFVEDKDIRAPRDILGSSVNFSPAADLSA